MFHFKSWKPSPLVPNRTYVKLQSGKKCLLILMEKRWCFNWTSGVFTYFLNVKRQKKTQQDATIRFLLSTSVSTCFGHHYAHIQENKDRVLLHTAYFFNVCHPEVFSTYINIQWRVTQTQQNFIIVLGQHVSILIESSSGPSKKIDRYLKCLKMRCGIPKRLHSWYNYKMHVSFRFAKRHMHFIHSYIKNEAFGDPTAHF